MTVGRAGRKGSRADGVSASIREDILAGRFTPGQRLTFPDLCAAYSVSVGVLREALVRLVDRGIVQAESNLGFRVMSLSEKDFQELTAVRAMVEPSFVRQAIEVGSPRWEADVVAAHHFMDRQPLTADGRLSDGLVRAHAEFHLVLVSGAGNRRMMEIVSRLRDEADLYLRWYLDVDQVEQRSDPPRGPRAPRGRPGSRFGPGRTAAAVPYRAQHRDLGLRARGREHDDRLGRALLVGHRRATPLRASSQIFECALTMRTCASSVATITCCGASALRLDGGAADGHSCSVRTPRRPGHDRGDTL